MMVKSIFRNRQPDAITTIETTIGAIVVIETDAMTVVMRPRLAYERDRYSGQSVQKSVQRLIVIAVAFNVVFAINAAWISGRRVNQPALIPIQTSTKY